MAPLIVTIFIVPTVFTIYPFSFCFTCDFSYLFVFSKSWFFLTTGVICNSGLLPLSSPSYYMEVIILVSFKLVGFSVRLYCEVCPDRITLGGFAKVL